MRPTKLNFEIQQRIVELIRAGNYIETASAVAGINKDTLYAWLKRGARERDRLALSSKTKPNKEETKFLEFSDAVNRAMAEAEARDVMIIANAAKNDWKASAWRLERKHPNKWGRHEHIDASITSEHTERKEFYIEQQIDSDPETMDLVRQLWRRKQAVEGR